ncbi:MAG: GNVR domain-containing protein [Armatimonadota bacterium]
MLENTQTSSISGKTLTRSTARGFLIVVLSVAICFCVGLYITATTPTTYEAQSTLLVNSTVNPGGGVSDMLSSMGLGRDSSSTGYATAILTSRTFAQQVIEKLNLLADKDFNQTRKLDMQQATTVLLKNIRVLDSKTGVLTLFVTGSTPQVVVRIANSYLTEFKGTAESTNTRKREFTSEKVTELKRDLESLEESLKQLNERRNVIDLPQQTAAAVTNLSALETQLRKVQTDLRATESDLATTGSLDELAKLKIKQQSLIAQQDQLTKQVASARAGMSEIPETALEQARLQREIDLKQKLFETVAQQNQLATIAEQGELSSYQILDVAYPPSDPVRPNPRMNMLVSIALGLAIGIAINLLLIPERREQGLQ